MAGMTQKNLCSFISIVVSCCTLDNCTRYFCQWSLVTGPMKTPDDKEGFFSRSGYSLQFCWSDLVITEIFSNSAASFLLVGACRCACSVPCFQDDLSVLEVFRLKVLKFANKVSNFFVCQVCLLNSYVLFQKQIKSPCHIELHLCCDRVPRFFSVFFSSIEVGIIGLLTKCHPERLLRKKINCSILHRFALLAHWLEDSQDYHVLRTWILFCKIFRISDNSPAVWLFHDIVIVFFLFL